MSYSIGMIFFERRTPPLRRAGFFFCMKKCYHIRVETQNDYQSYTIKTAGFEGPFGLLLALVEKRKLFINDVSLAEVTEEYLQYINSNNNIKISTTTTIVIMLIIILIIL